MHHASYIQPTRPQSSGESSASPASLPRANHVTLRHRCRPGSSDAPIEKSQTHSSRNYSYRNTSQPHQHYSLRSQSTSKWLLAVHPELYALRRGNWRRRPSSVGRLSPRSMLQGQASLLRRGLLFRRPLCRRGGSRPWILRGRRRRCMVGSAVQGDQLHAIGADWCVQSVRTGRGRSFW